MPKTESGNVALTENAEKIVDNVDPEIILEKCACIAAQCGLDGWTFQLADIDYKGTCDLNNKIISLSPRKMTSWDDARLTVRHELAHALMAEQHGVAHCCVTEYIRKQFQNG